MLGILGVVVVVFDEDESDEKYFYWMIWFGEYDDEFDMVFYGMVLFE